MNKKIFKLILGSFILASVVGCSFGNENPSTNGGNSSEVSENTSSENSSEEQSSENTSSENSSEEQSSENSSENSSSTGGSSGGGSSSEQDPNIKEEEWDFYRTVTFDSKGGTSISSKEVFEGDKVVKPQDPTKGNDTFIGWYLNGALYDFNSPVYFDITLEARWENDAPTLTANKVNFSNSLTADGTQEQGPLTEGCLPSYKVDNENPKILVFPVRLSSSYNASTYDNYLEDINIAFNGTKEQTGWESVKTYYHDSSYGKLNLDITVHDEWFYDSSISASSLQNMYDEYYAYESEVDPNEYLITKILDKYNSSIDYSDYDSNGDGFIDSIWLIYDEDVNFEDDNSMYWAYTSWNYEWYDESYSDYINPSKARDGVYPFYYAWAGTDFMYPSVNGANYNTDNIEIDAHTYIHETGHLLGLDDYYDYDDNVGVNRGLYGADMMDYNIGDHGVISKLLLDWIDPRVVEGEGSGSFNLNSFTTTGDCIIIADHELEDIYDTYYVIEYYTNDGLNANDEPISGNGIRITLVHAEINIVNGEVDWNGGSYDTSFKYDNTDSTTPFVEMLSHKTINGSIDGTYLFTEGKTFTCDLFELEVETLTSSNATVNITLK